MKKLIIAFTMTVILAMTSVTPISAATKEVPITGVSFPTTVTMKMGESR